VIRSPLGLFALATAGGIAGLLLFWYRLFAPVEFDAVSLPVVALVGGIAATFNPCALPALPGFLARSARPGRPGSDRAVPLAAGTGAASVVVVFGLTVAALGAAAENALEPPVHSVQLALGLIVASLAILQLIDRADVIPLVGWLARLGARAWDAAVRRPGLRGSYVFGGAFIAIGAT